MPLLALRSINRKLTELYNAWKEYEDHHIKFIIGVGDGEEKTQAVANHLVQIDIYNEAVKEAEELRYTTLKAANPTNQEQGDQGAVNVPPVVDKPKKQDQLNAKVTHTSVLLLAKILFNSSRISTIPESQSQINNLLK